MMGRAQTHQLQGVRDKPEEGLEGPVAELGPIPEIREGCLKEGHYYWVLQDEREPGRQAGREPHPVYPCSAA